MTDNDVTQPGGEILFYQTEDGRTRIECRFEDNSLWLSQTLTADLFQTTVPNINLHIKNILSEGELTEAATIKDYLIVRSEGTRQVSRDGERSEAATCKFYLQVRQEGGLGKVHQLFGDKLNTIIEELLVCARSAGRLACACAEGRHAGRNETLAA